MGSTAIAAVSGWRYLLNYRTYFWLTLLCISCHLQTTLVACSVVPTRITAASCAQLHIHNWSQQCCVISFGVIRSPAWPFRSPGLWGLCPWQPGGLCSLPSVTEGLGCHFPCWTCASKPRFVRVGVHRFVCGREGLHAASRHHRHHVHKSHRGALAPKEGHSPRRVLQETPPCHQRVTPLLVFLGGWVFWFRLGFVVVWFWQQLQTEGGL